MATAKNRSDLKTESDGSFPSGTGGIAASDHRSYNDNQSASALNIIDTADQSIVSLVRFLSNLIVDGKIGIATTNPNTLLSLGDTSSIIATDTSDGSDNKRISIAGGGLLSTSRGGYVIAHGNEYATDGGSIWISSGNVAGTKIELRAKGSPTVGVFIDENGKTEFKGQAVPNSSTSQTVISYTATPTFNFNNGHVQKMTLSGNITTFATSNESAGGFYMIWIINDATPGRTVAAPTGWTAAASSDTHSTDANAINLYQFFTDPANTLKYYSIVNL